MESQAKKRICSSTFNLVFRNQIKLSNQYLLLNDNTPMNSLPHIHNKFHWIRNFNCVFSLCVCVQYFLDECLAFFYAKEKDNNFPYNWIFMQCTEYFITQFRCNVLLLYLELNFPLRAINTVVWYYMNMLVVQSKWNYRHIYAVISCIAQ